MAQLRDLDQHTFDAITQFCSPGPQAEATGVAACSRYARASWRRERFRQKVLRVIRVYALHHAHGRGHHDAPYGRWARRAVLGGDVGIGPAMTHIPPLGCCCGQHDAHPAHPAADEWNHRGIAVICCGSATATQYGAAVWLVSDTDWAQDGLFHGLAVGIEASWGTIWSCGRYWAAASVDDLRTHGNNMYNFWVGWPPHSLPLRLPAAPTIPRSLALRLRYPTLAVAVGFVEVAPVRNIDETPVRFPADQRARWGHRSQLQTFAQEHGIRHRRRAGPRLSRERLDTSAHGRGHHGDVFAHRQALITSYFPPVE
jgi:hypothetical protein